MSMNTVLQNNHLIINIISFIIDPPVLITDCYYNKNKLIFLCDKNYSNSYFHSEIKKYINNNNTFLNIINNVLYRNKQYLICGNIHFSNDFLLNKWKKTHFYILDESVKSLNDYIVKFYNFLKNNIRFDNISKVNNISDYLDLLTNIIINYDNYIKILELQFRIRYISIYFNDYLILHNDNLNKFTVTNIISFIKNEEHLLYEFI